MAFFCFPSASSRCRSLRASIYSSISRCLQTDRSGPGLPLSRLLSQVVAATVRASLTAAFKSNKLANMMVEFLHAALKNRASSQ